MDVKNRKHWYSKWTPKISQDYWDVLKRFTLQEYFNIASKWNLLGRRLRSIVFF